MTPTNAAGVHSTSVTSTTRSPRNMRGTVTPMNACVDSTSAASTRSPRSTRYPRGGGRAARNEAGRGLCAVPRGRRREEEAAHGRGRRRCGRDSPNRCSSIARVSMRARWRIADDHRAEAVAAMWEQRASSGKHGRFKVMIPIGLAARPAGALAH